MLVVLFVAVFQQVASGFVAVSSSTALVPPLSAKGFAAPKKVRPKSEKKIEKERAAQAYDDAKAKGIPEYRVFVKDEKTSWLPVGKVTVPRTEPVEQAIFGNGEALERAARGAYRQLGDDLEYGYNLAVFPDDPVRAADPQKVNANSNNPLTKWIKDLTSPINAAK